MSLKLPHDKKRNKRIPVPVNAAEKAAIEKLAAARGVSAAQILREAALMPRESEKGVKKTKAA